MFRSINPSSGKEYLHLLLPVDEAMRRNVVNNKDVLFLSFFGRW